MCRSAESNASTTSTACNNGSLASLPERLESSPPVTRSEHEKAPYFGGTLGNEESATPPRPSYSTDSCRSWLVCAGCAVLISAASVGFRCSGFFLVAIATEFAVPWGQASWPSSVLNVMTFAAGIIAGPIVQKYRLRPMLIASVVCNGAGFIVAAFAHDIPLLAFGFALHGFGCGCILVITSVLLSQYFDRHRGTAFGIANASSPLTSFLFPPIVKVLLESVGFKGTILTIGIALTCLIPVGVALNDAPWIDRRTSTTEDTNSNEKPSSGKTAGSLFRKPMLYVILLGNIAFQWTFDTFLATIVDYGMQKNLSMQDGVTIIVFYSAADLAGRLLLPLLADHGWMGRDSLVTCSYLLSSAMIALLCFCESLTSFVVLIVCLGPFFGLSGMYYNSVVAQYLGMESLGLAYGFIGFMAGIVFLLMPFSLALFRDILADYRWMYMTNSSLLLVASLPWLIVVLRRKLNRPK